MAVTLTTAKLFPSDNQIKLTQDTRVSNPENVYSVNNVYATSTTDLTKNQNSDRYTYKDFSSVSVNTDCTVVSLDIFVMMRSTTVAGRDGVILQPKISGIGNGSLGTVVTTTTNSNVWLEALPSGDGYWGFAPANLTVSNLQSSNFVIFSSLINSAYFGNTNVLVDAISYSYQYEMHLNSSVIGAVSTSANFSTEIIFDGDLLGASSTSSVFETSITFDVDVLGTTQTEAEFSTEILMAGALSSSASTTADLLTSINFVTNVSGASSTSANISTEVLLAASVSALAEVVGNLQVGFIIESPPSIVFLEDKYSIAIVEDKYSIEIVEDKYACTSVSSDKYQVAQEV
tara:strand:- start:109 stop:1143 length:1035 start_codon:yes stop_codon:yes gene_type:complete